MGEREGRRGGRESDCHLGRAGMDETCRLSRVHRRLGDLPGRCEDDQVSHFEGFYAGVLNVLTISPKGGHHAEPIHRIAQVP